MLLRRHPYASSLIICSAVLGVFLIATNPNQMSVGLLIIPAVLLLFIFFCGSHIILSSLKILSDKPRKRRTVALIAGSLLTVILILKSSGGISLADLILLGLIITVISVYVSKF